jgi:NTP pyrophosphatase (non-canonical NTP hydrolase)
VDRPEQLSLDSARQRAMEIRALYEAIERRVNGQVWTLQELTLGFSNDVGTVGRLVLAHEGTWEIDGDVDAQLAHKLSESLWWVIVIAERLGIDISTAFADTMDTIERGLAPRSADPRLDPEPPPAR